MVHENYEIIYKTLNDYFDISNNNQEPDFSIIKKIKSYFEEKLLAIKKDFNALNENFNNNIGNITKDLSISQLDNIFSSNLDMPNLPEEKKHFLNFDNLKPDSPLLSMPTISKKNGILKCNYNKMSFQKGPFCPEFYSEPIKLKIMSLIDEEIQAEIEEIPDEGEDDNEKDEEIEVTEKEILEDFNEKINVIDRHDIDLYKYMKVKKNFLAKEPIEVEIYIPNLISKDKKEIQKIKRLLKLKAGTSECKIIIEMNIITVPLQILFSCENYQLQYINENYYLKTEQLL